MPRKYPNKSPIPLFKNAKELISDFNKIAKEVYIETKEYAYSSTVIKPKPVNSASNNIVEHDLKFNEIKETLIQGIRNAKYIIWMAVAWFTDEDLYHELLEKKTQRVNIRIITSDEKSNSKLMNLLVASFDVVKCPQHGYNRMHDKFC